MAVTYPLTPPAAPGPKSFSGAANNAVGLAVSPFTWSSQAQQWQGEHWEWSFQMPAMSQATALAWVAFLTAMRGQYGTCLLKDPTYDGPTGIATGTPLVNGAQAAQAIVLNTDGWTANKTGILKAGDYIQLTGASKHLHMVVQDANSDSGGHAALDIFPRLRESVADNQAIVLVNPVGTFRLAGNKRNWSVNEALNYGISFDVVEAL